MATSRIIVIGCQMRFFRLHGGGEKDDEIVFINCHLHYMTAKKEVSDGARSLKRFFDELAGYIVEFGARILAGDVNLIN